MSMGCYTHIGLSKYNVDTLDSAAPLPGRASALGDGGGTALWRDQTGQDKRFVCRDRERKKKKTGRTGIYQEGSFCQMGV